jgi:hypothetical protein
MRRRRTTSSPKFRTVSVAIARAMLSNAAMTAYQVAGSV